MRLLVIDDAAREAIQAIKEWADQNRYTYHQIKRIIEGLDPPPGDLEALTLEGGFRVVYSIEQQPEEGEFVWCHHLSVSVSNDPKVWPHPAAVNIIAEEFGINIEQSFVYLENENNDHLPSAVNLVAKIV